MRMRTIAILAAIGLGVTAGCSKDHSLETVVNPRDPEHTGIRPPVPTSLEASVGNRRVQITWGLTRSDSSLVDSIRVYRIYRAERDSTPVLSDSTTHPPVSLSGLVNGTEYRVTIASVLSNGLEGKRSASVTAVPGLFGLQLNEGREVTQSPSVRLALVAPAGARGLQVANGPALDGAPTQPFVSDLTWQLATGDGEKEVFARIIDAEGNLSLSVSDRIRLDTRADIASLTFDPAQAGPGDQLRFRLDAGEPHGRARVSLGTGGRQLDLRDDGGAADATADDGVYALAYTVPPDLALEDVLVTGDFTDEAGNVAPTLSAAARLTVRHDPPAVTLEPIVSPAAGELYLSWSEVPDAGRFSAYRLLRAEAPGVDTSRTRVQVSQITGRSNTTYTDTDLDPNRTYYYRVTVVDPNGRTSTSNEEAGRPRLAPAPDPVTLEAPSNVTEVSVFLSFSRCLAPSFAQYRVFRGEQQGLDTDPKRRLLTTLTSAGATTYEDRVELEQGMRYWYRVDVADGNGTTSKSNTVSALIPDLPPAAVTLNTPTSTGETTVNLSWGQSNILDFLRYEVRRSSTAGVGPQGDSLASFEEKESVGFLDSGLTENTAYFYRVFVVDKGYHGTGSNELSVTTANADPSPVTLTVPAEMPDEPTPSIALEWEISLAHDFAEYRLYRDTSPRVGESSTLVRTIADSVAHSYLDAGLTDNRLVDNTRYYYRVFVRDDAGGKAGSNEQSVVTRNRPPTPVTLSLGLVDSTAKSISLNWTQNNDHDFNEYLLLQGTTSAAVSDTVISFTQKTQRSHTVFVPSDSTRYFFKVVVYDKGLESLTRLSTESNAVSARARQN